jgi:predicted MFS family arabinose efflux permease
MDAISQDTRLAGGGWGAVLCMSLMTFVLIASEFMPVSLLTPIARDLAITEGQAGQAIAVSGFFAVVTSLFGNLLLSRLDRRTVVLLYTGILLVSGLAVTFAQDGLVFMLGRALVGISVGGFWSLSTAIVARLVKPAELPKALSMLQAGTALAAVIAAPMGSFLGGLVGWRGAFFVVVPISLAGFLWQLQALPKMPPRDDVTLAGMFRLLGSRTVLLGMAATTLAFMGQFSLSTYLRPFLEGVTGLDVNGLSLVLLCLGLAGLAGTSVVGFMLGSLLDLLLVGLPLVLASVAVLLVLTGAWPLAVTALLIVWGFFTTPIPVAWGTWMTRVIPNDLEAGGGLQVALVQLAITAGAFLGGLLFDAAGWWGSFVLGATLLMGSALFALAACATRAKSRKVPHRSQNVARSSDTWDRPINGGIDGKLDWAASHLIEQVSSK